MKTCFKCNKTKPLSDFYAHKQMADGHLNKCKECTKNDVHIHRSENIERIQEYDRERGKLQHRKENCTIYRKNHLEEFAARNREYYHRDPSRVLAAKKLWAESNPEKRHAHNLVNAAVRDGKLLRLPCSVCNNQKSEAHHEDYSRPLDVVWLCRKHHAELHEQRHDYRRAA